MANTIKDNIPNGTKLSIKLSTDTGSTFTEVKGVENVNPPDQSFNTVEAKLLNAENGISPRFLGSRNGGEISFKINVIDGEDAGLLKVITAYEGKVESTFQITYPSGAMRTVPNVKLTKCTCADHAVDSMLAYDVSGIVNGLMTITEAD